MAPGGDWFGLEKFGGVPFEVSQVGGFYDFKEFLGFVVFVVEISVEVEARLDEGSQGIKLAFDWHLIVFASLICGGIYFSVFIYAGVDVNMTLTSDVILTYNWGRNLKEVFGMNVEIQDNGSAFIIVVNGLITSHHSSLGDAWRHVQWMYRVASQKFTVGKKEIPVTEWLEHMVAIGYLE